MDILYVVGRRLSQWNDNELRYSLRSIDKYGMNVGRVFIAGYCPPFVDRDAVTFVPVKDATPVKHYNIQRAIEAAVEQTEIGDEFLYSSDDHFYIAPTDFDNYPFYWRGVELPIVARTEYERTLVSTRRLLECCGLPTKHLAWHGNTHFCRRLWESERFALMRRFALTMPDGCEPTCLMLNYRLAVEGVELTAREIVVLENVNDGEWDGLENWNADELQEWGVTSELGVFGDEEGEDEIQRKLQEFKERIQAGELREDSEEYQEFLEKFKLKKTTDDCYTPELVYNAVAEFVEMRYNLSRVNFVRPFYPGGDYQREKYKKTDVIVDNPPFSILAEILQFFNKNGIRFFLFAPHLTLFSSSSSSSTALVTGVAITYENGASVNTSFLTNLEPRDIRLMSCPELYAAVRVANEENLKQQKKQLPKYSYDLHVITSTSVAPYSRLGIEFVVPVAESVSIDSLDEQKKSGKAIYGKGYLVSDRLFAEREKAEREKAEREKAERWNLSQREREIVAKLTIASESA